MFVFTVTNTVDESVYIGSARESIENQWAIIVEAASGGQMGELHESIRQEGADAFLVEEWAFAENSQELRELMSEARQSLQAQTIRVGRQTAAARAPDSKSESKVSQEIRDLFSLAKAELEQADDDEGFDSSSEPGLDSGVDIDASKKPELSQAAEAGSSTSSEAQLPAGGKRAQARRIREAIAAERDQRATLRHQQGSNEAKEMRDVMVQIEQRRLSQKKKPAAKRSSAASKRAAVSSKPPKKAAAKPADKAVAARGRTGSKLKEQRIKEAIAQEKAALDQAKSQQVSAQADEMAALLNRLDSRSKTAATYKRKL